MDIGFTWHTDEEGAHGTAEEVRGCGRRCETLQVSLENSSEAAGLMDALAEALGSPDVLVNNAGTGASSPFIDTPLDSWRRVLDVDLTAPFLVGQAADRRMIAAGRAGRIINVTSVHEHVPLPSHDRRPRRRPAHHRAPGDTRPPAGRRPRGCRGHRLPCLTGGQLCHR
jgi:NAD(P)-dependent dehydrogenase (short-subunit alcohol dehydrogenase family)